jgi:hypothetical protein
MGEMDDERVAKEFQRIQTIASLEKESEIIASCQEGLAAAWRRVGKSRYNIEARLAR